MTDRLPLFLLARGDCRRLAQRVSCDQDIASDGFFSLGMLAEFDASLREFGPAFYRHLFWESGVVGQVLYLAAEAAGARATGIGCFYDEPVHDVFGLAGSRVPESVSLHDRDAGGGRTVVDGARVRLGVTRGVQLQSRSHETTKARRRLFVLFFSLRVFVAANRVRRERHRSDWRSLGLS